MLGVIAALVLTMPPAQTLADIASSVFAQGGTPGMAVTVVQHGSVAYSGGFGYADPAAKRPATPDTRFAIGSLSKQFTAVSVLSLVQNGRLSLDDRLAKYFPQLPHADTITIRELLNQTSGLHNYPDTREHAWPLSGHVSLENIIAVLATDKPDFAPGTRYEYSNSNYTVLAAIVQKVSGVPFERYLQQHIFDRLGMRESGYGYALQHSGNLAVPYVGGKPAPMQLTLDLYGGAGGIISTANDLARWDAALLAGSILDARSMRELWTAGHPASGSSNYAMGFVADTLDGHSYVWHNGYAPYAGGYCYNAIFPQQHLAIVVLTNGDIESEQGKPETLVRRIFEAYVPPTALRGDPAIGALAKKTLRGFQTGDVDRADMTPGFAAILTPAVLRQSKTIWAPLGEPQSFSLTGTSTRDGSTEYIYRVEFPGGNVESLVIFIKSGKVAGFTMR
jgi:CubicO group peptidase (beta-lactamase class C family)